MNEGPRKPKPGSAAPTSTVPRRLTSTELFGRNGFVEIDHQGEIYRLQITRQGKLILTK